MLVVVVVLLLLLRLLLLLLLMMLLLLLLLVRCLCWCCRDKMPALLLLLLLLHITIMATHCCNSQPMHDHTCATSLLLPLLSMQITITQAAVGAAAQWLLPLLPLFFKNSGYSSCTHYHDRPTDCTGPWLVSAARVYAPAYGCAAFPENLCHWYLRVGHVLSGSTVLAHAGPALSRVVSQGIHPCPTLCILVANQCIRHASLAQADWKPSSFATPHRNDTGNHRPDP